MDQRGYMVEAESSVKLHGAPADVLQAVAPPEDLWTSPLPATEVERHATFTRKMTDAGMLEIAIEWRGSPSESADLIVRAYINSDPYERIAWVASPIAALVGLGVSLAFTRGIGMVVSAAVLLLGTRWIVTSVLPRRRARAEAKHRLDALLKRGIVLNVFEAAAPTLDLELR